MRILIAAGFLGHFGETDGIVTTYRHLLPFLARSGMSVDVVCYGRQDRIEVMKDVRVFVHRPRLPIRIDARRWIDAAFAWSSLARRCSRTSYSLVQSSTPDPLGLWASIVARNCHSPFLALYHTALADYAAIRGRRAAGPLAGRVLGASMDRWELRYFNRADLILAPSHSAVETVTERFSPPAAVLGRGVDATWFHPRKRSRSGGVPRALYVGRVSPEKNLDWLATAFARRRDVQLTVVGDGISLDGLKRRLPLALFRGRLVGEPLAIEYANADFLVFPSRTDTLGNVVLEAMASGLPVIVSDAMGPKELVCHGTTGLIVRTDDEFAHAVDTLASDQTVRQLMGLEARRFAETRSWATIYDQLIAYYQRLLACRSAFDCAESDPKSSDRCFA